VILWHTYPAAAHWRLALLVPLRLAPAVLSDLPSLVDQKLLHVKVIAIRAPARGTQSSLRLDSSGRLHEFSESWCMTNRITGDLSG